MSKIQYIQFINLYKDYPNRTERFVLVKVSYSKFIVRKISIMFMNIGMDIYLQKNDPQN